MEYSWEFEHLWQKSTGIFQALSGEHLCVGLAMIKQQWQQYHGKDVFSFKSFFSPCFHSFYDEGFSVRQALWKRKYRWTGGAHCDYLGRGSWNTIEKSILVFRIDSVRRPYGTTSRQDTRKKERLTSKRLILWTECLSEKRLILMLLLKEVKKILLSLKSLWVHACLVWLSFLW